MNRTNDETTKFLIDEDVLTNLDFSHRKLKDNVNWYIF